MGFAILAAAAGLQFTGLLGAGLFAGSVALLGALPAFKNVRKHFPFGRRHGPKVIA